jgi:aminomethyltransferase
MGEFVFSGPGAADFLQQMTINNVNKLAVGQAQYSAICFDDGGLVDDLLLYRFEDYYMMVVNASNIQKDWDWLKQHVPANIEMKNASDEITLIAVQGPKSLDLVQKLTQIDLSEIKYYHFVEGELAGVPTIISRTGYTGEFGFELYIKNEYGPKLWQEVFNAGKEFDIEPIGLGARDTLRLEMAYCLYGNDIDHTTNPLEAGLGWITKLKKGDFNCREALLKIKEDGIKRKLIGFQMNGRAFPRHGYPIYHAGNQVGHVTSGTFSPMLNIGIGMGYVEKQLNEVGTPLEIEIRNKMEPATIVETPFYKHQ